MNITIKTFENADPDSAIKAHANMTIDNAFVIKNLSVVQGKNGLFVNMPHHKTNDIDEEGKPIYKDDAFPLKKDLRDMIRDAAVESYENGGSEVTIEYDTAQKDKTKSNPEKSGKEGVRQERASVLNELDNEKKTGMDKPIKLSMAPAKKAAGETR